MSRISGKIYKVLKGLELAGNIHLIDKNQLWSPKFKKACNLFKIYKVYSIEEYKIIDPKFKAKEKQVNVRKKVFSSFREIEALLYLVSVLKKTKEG